MTPQARIGGPALFDTLLKRPWPEQIQACRHATALRSRPLQLFKSLPQEAARSDVKVYCYLPATPSLLTHRLNPHGSLRSPPQLFVKQRQDRYMSKAAGVPRSTDTLAWNARMPARVHQKTNKKAQSSPLPHKGVKKLSIGCSKLTFPPQNMI